MEKLLGRLFTVEEAADLLRVETQTIYKWIREGKLTCIKLAGTTVRIREDDLKLFILSAMEAGR